MQNLREAFGDEAANSPEAQALLQYAEEIQKLWDAGLKAAVANRQAGMKNAAPEGGVRYARSIEGSLNEDEVEAALKDALDHKSTINDNLIKAGKLPEFIVNLTGIEGDLYLHRDHVYENMVSAERAKEEDRFRSYRKGHYHDFGIEKVKQAIMAIDKPMMTLWDQAKNENPTITMLLPVESKKGFVTYASLSFYSRGDINGRYEKKPHVVLTIAEREAESNDGHIGFGEIIDKAINSDRVLSFDKEKRADLTVNAKATRLGIISDTALMKNVSRFKKFVNRFRTENKINYSVSDTVSDRSLLLEAAERAGASEELRRFAKKQAELERLQRRLEKIEGTRAVEGAGPYEGNQERARPRAGAGPYEGDGETTTPQSARRADSSPDKGSQIRGEIEKVEAQLDRMEKGAVLQREVKELRESWFKQNAAEAVQVQREIQQENRELREAVEFYKAQAKLTPVSERRVRPQDVARFARALLKEHESGADLDGVRQKLQAIGDYLVSGDGLNGKSGGADAPPLFV